MRPAVLLLILLFSVGCAAHRAPGSRPADSIDGLLDARTAPPAGWIPQPIEAGQHHTQQVWLSPSTHTAYGVIHFNLPLPVGHEPVLWIILGKMRSVDGSASVLSRHWDESMDQLHFVAQSPVHTMRIALTVRGVEGWAVYAGTLTKEPIDEDELALAEAAVEATTVGGRNSKPEGRNPKPETRMTNQ